MQFATDLGVMGLVTFLGYIIGIFLSVWIVSYIAAAAGDEGDDAHRSIAAVAVLWPVVLVIGGVVAFAYFVVWRVLLRGPDRFVRFLHRHATIIGRQYHDQRRSQ